MGQKVRCIDILKRFVAQNLFRHLRNQVHPKNAFSFHEMSHSSAIFVLLNSSKYTFFLLAKLHCSKLYLSKLLAFALKVTLICLLHIFYMSSSRVSTG